MTQIRFGQAGVLGIAAWITIGNAFIFCQEVPKNTEAPAGQKLTGSSASTDDRDKSVKGNQAATDQYGDALPPGALARLGTVRFRHSSRAGPLAYSADGKTLLSAGITLRVWDVATGKLMREVPWQHSAVHSVAISPDCRSIAEIGTTPTGGAVDVVHLRDAATGKEVGQFPGDHSWDFIHGGALKPIPRSLGVVAFAPDGKQLVTASNPFIGRDKGAAGVIRLWDIASKTEIQSFETPDGSVLSFQFALSGDLLAWLGNFPVLVLRNVTKGKELGRFILPKGSYAGALSPDGKVVALTGQNPATNASGAYQTNGFLELRDFASGRVLYKTKPQSSGIYGLVWSPDGATLAWTEGDHFVRICDSATGKPRFSANGHTDEINYLRFGPGGKTLISGSRDGTARVWDVATRKELRRFETRQGYLETIALSPDGKTIASPIGPRLWDANTGKEWPQFAHHEMGTNCVAFSPDGPDGKSLAAPGKDRAIHVWDLATGKELLRCGEQSLGGTPVRSIAYSPDGKILATTNDYGMRRASGKVDFWEVATGRQIRTFASGKMVSYHSLAFSPNGKMLVTGSGWWGRGSGICLWDVSTGLEIEPSVRQVDSALSVIFSPDNRYLISTEREGTVRLSEVATRMEVKHFTGPDGPVKAVAFSPDGKTIATAASDTSILLWPTLTPGLQTGGKPRVLTAEELRNSWADLAGHDAAKSFQAIELLVAAPQQSVPFIKEQLSPLLVNVKQIAKLITDLDDDSFEVREKATSQLEKLGVIAEPDLRAKLAEQPSAEVRLRAERILREVPRSNKASGILQAALAITTLEYVGTPEARRLLQSISQMKPKDWLTEEANDSLKRLAEGDGGPP